MARFVRRPLTVDAIQVTDVFAAIEANEPDKLPPWFRERQKQGDIKVWPNDIQLWTPAGKMTAHKGGWVVLRDAPGNEPRVLAAYTDLSFQREFKPIEEPSA